MSPRKRPIQIEDKITERPDSKPRILLVDDSVFSLSQVRKALGEGFVTSRDRLAASRFS